jgi:hypothetical protein
VQSTESIQVQKDWDDREFVEIIQLNILKITSFLNQFDLSIRYKMSTLNEKLNKLERTIEYVECAFKTSTGIDLFNCFFLILF